MASFISRAIREPLYETDANKEAVLTKLREWWKADKAARRYIEDVAEALKDGNVKADWDIVREMVNEAATIGSNREAESAWLRKAERG